jgi:hypothetical protein
LKTLIRAFVEPRVVVQENNAFSEHPAPFVLDRPPKVIQCFTTSDVIVVPGAMNSVNRISL